MRPLVPFPYDNRHHPLNRIPIGHIRIETYLSYGGLHMPEISLHFVQEQPDGVGGCMFGSWTANAGLFTFARAKEFVLYFLDKQTGW